MLWIKALTLIVLLAIFAQDIASRSVYWVVFPLLAVLLVLLRLTLHEPLADIWRSAMINNGFLLIQLLLVSIYFSLKRGYWVNITKQLLGWGDVLFLLCTACYLSILNFLFFYISSLTISLFFWLTSQLLVNTKKQLLVNIRQREIPLAGFQSILFALFLVIDWWPLHLHLTADDWLLNLITK